jgi:hypothetical protein
VMRGRGAEIAFIGAGATLRVYLSASASVRTSLPLLVSVPLPVPLSVPLSVPPSVRAFMAAGVGRDGREGRKGCACVRRCKPSYVRVLVWIQDSRCGDGEYFCHTIEQCLPLVAACLPLS